jgi:hypothetical protein
MNDIEQRLTDREKRLFITLCALYKSYTDCNPEVGIGPFPSTIIKWAEEKSKIILHIVDKADIAEYISKNCY